MVEAQVELRDTGLIAVSGADARAFLHAQLTSDVANLPPHQARRAGWCSPKGRLLATLLVVPQGEAFLLQVSADLVPAVLKRLQMFVLRSKVRLADVSADWLQAGVSGPEAAQRVAALGLAVPAADLELAAGDASIVVRLDAARYLVLAEGEARARLSASLAGGDASAWALAEIRAGVPRVTLATQDLFVPQMVNLERIAGVDFHKGCYPGQEVVARAQYRGQLKRRMVRVRAPAPLRAGQDLFSDDSASQPSGTVVSAAQGEALAVVQIATLDSGAALRAEPGGAALDVLPLPYAA